MTHYIEPCTHSYGTICRKRVANVPKYTAKKEWANVNTELKSYAYNLRQAVNRYVIRSLVMP